MAFDINFAAAIKAGKPDSYSKAVGFPGSTAEKTYSFRDSLKEAVRNKTEDGIKADDRTALRKEMVNNSASKLKRRKKLDRKEDEVLDSTEESKEQQTDKMKMTIEQILQKLQELTKLQQQGEIPAEKHMALLESIQEALGELEAVQTGIEPGVQQLQTKAAESAAVLESFLQELKTNGSMTDNNAEVDFLAELKTILAQESERSKAAADDKNAIVAVEPETDMTKISEINNIQVKNEKVTDAAAQKSGENENLTAESKQSNDAVLNKNQDTKAEAPVADSKTVSKEAKPEVEENTEDIKAVLESKVEKAAEYSKENKQQDAETGNNKEAAKEVHKLVNAANNKPENAGITAVNPDQKITDNKIEAAQIQTAAKPVVVNKAEIINQIVKKAEIVLTDSQPEMRMQLEPENLGKLTLKLAVEKGLITAKFVAESYEVKQVIESNFNELKDMLQEKGLEVQNFSVSVGQEGKEYNDSNSFQQWKETVRLNGRSMNRGGYEGYLEGEGASIRTVNPYSIHNGKFDHRA